MNGRGVDHSIPSLPSEGAGNPVECLPGAILWLPPESHIPRFSGSELPSDCYDHPVAILEARKGGNVAIFILTSFHEKSLAISRPRDLEVRNYYLPIAPSEPHPENGRLLHLNNQSKQPLRKKSYINAERLYTVPLGALRHYDRDAGARTSDYILSNDSFDSLVKHFRGLRARRTILGAMGSNGGTPGTPARLIVHHPTVYTPLLPSNNNRTSIPPLASERPSPPGSHRPGGFVRIQAMATPSSVGQAPWNWNNYGTNTPYRPLDWDSGRAWRRQHRTPQSLGPRSPQREGHKRFPLLRVILALIACTLLSAAVYGLVLVVYSFSMWLLGVLKDVGHWAEAVWIAIRDIVIKWIEALKWHGG